MLDTELDVQKAQEVVNLGERGDRALAPAATGSLLDCHGGRDAMQGVYVWARGGLDKLTRVRVQ